MLTIRATPTASLQSDINITPLVDVCLVLLIIFIVVTPILVNPVRLPEAVTAEDLSKRPIEITVNVDRTIYLESMAIREEQLSSELARRHTRLSRPVVVRADRALIYGDVVRVLDACRNAGFENVGLATTRVTRLPATGNRQPATMSAAAPRAR